MAQIYATTYKSKTVLFLYDDAGELVVPNNSVRKSVTSGSFGVGKSWQKRDFSKFNLMEYQIDLEYLVTSESERDALISFFKTTAAGRLNAFWCPSYINDFTIIQSANGTGVNVQDAFLSGLMGYPDDGVKYRHLVIFKDDFASTPQLVELTSINQLSGASYEGLTLDTWSYYTPESVFMRLFYCRLASDSLKVSFAGDGRYRINFSCKELQRETPT